MINNICEFMEKNFEKYKNLAAHVAQYQLESDMIFKLGEANALALMSGEKSDLEIPDNII